VRWGLPAPPAKVTLSLDIQKRLVVYYRLQ
jgi:hypothetical protein